jgi:hypothetical protein
MNGVYEIHKAIKNKLSSDPTLSGMVTGILDNPSKDQSFPYIVIEASETPNNTFNRKGRNVVVTIHIYSRHQGSKEGLQIYSRLNELLDVEPLSLDTFSLVYLEFQSMVPFTEPDGITRHFVIEYQSFVQE